MRLSGAASGGTAKLVAALLPLLSEEALRCHTDAAVRRAALAALAGVPGVPGGPFSTAASGAPAAGGLSAIPALPADILSGLEELRRRGLGVAAGAGAADPTAKGAQGNIHIHDIATGKQ